MTRENTIAAAILGELIPELEYAAPVLLERADRGDPLVGTTSPTDLGFEPGDVDSVLLEFFKALVPYVKMMLGWGLLSVIQVWLLAERDTRHHAELVVRLDAAIEEEVKLRETAERIADLVARMDGALVSRHDLAKLIAAASYRVGETDDTRPRL